MNDSTPEQPQGTPLPDAPQAKREGTAEHAALDAFLESRALAAPGQPRRYQALAGGISSDIWRVDIGEGTEARTLCVKRALPQLKVQADWRAPVSRNAFEWAWLEYASSVVPQAVPKPIAHDAAAGLFAMSFLEPARHPVWKQQLLAGLVQPATAAAVGALVARLHQTSAHRADLAAAFASGPNFYALRLAPYLLATAGRHPALALPLQALVHRTAETRIALVHGDVSPKNILVGPAGPVLLDAECAWYGDPAFDIAFCLNHLVLKVLVRPDAAEALAESFAAWTEAYFDGIGFESRAALERRAAALLPALMLARVDGKSPVEYLSDEAQRERVREFASPQIARPAATLAEVAAHKF
jgi:aminoglycoside phosphotransferase (APT) family kinase protein